VLHGLTDGHEQFQPLFWGEPALVAEFRDGDALRRAEILTLPILHRAREGTIYPSSSAAQPARRLRMKAKTKRRWPKNRLLVRSTDDVVAILRKGKLDPDGELFKSAWRSAFPLSSMKKRDMLFTRAAEYMTNRMRHAWHPLAKSLVYAYAYRPAGEQSDWDELPVKKLVKIGTSYDPRQRQKAHIAEIRARLELDELEMVARLLIVPIRHAESGCVLESALESCLPKEVHVNGEWYRDTIGVWKGLVKFFPACHAEYRLPRRKLSLS